MCIDDLRFSSHWEPISHWSFSISSQGLDYNLAGRLDASKSRPQWQVSQGLLCGKEWLLLSWGSAVLLECSGWSLCLPRCAKSSCTSNRVWTRLEAYCSFLGSCGKELTASFHAAESTPTDFPNREGRLRLSLWTSGWFRSQKNKTQQWFCLSLTIRKEDLESFRKEIVWFYADEAERECEGPLLYPERSPVLKEEGRGLRSPDATPVPASLWHSSPSKGLWDSTEAHLGYSQGPWRESKGRACKSCS